MKSRSRFSRRGWRWATVAFGCALAPSLSGGQGFEPDLSETLEWIAPNLAMEPRIPAGAAELTRHALSPEAMKPLLDQLPDRPFHVLEPPPTSVAWWKYPLYAVVGFPRDLVDGVFGFFSYWPILNVPLVGIPYELVPAQVLFRHPADWHPWPGGRNRRGHGWTDGGRVVRDGRLLNADQALEEREGLGLVDDAGWGFFSNARRTRFSYVSQSKLRRYEAENERRREELQALNRRIDAENRTLTERLRGRRAAAIEAIDRGDGFEAVGLMLPYHLAYPTETQAQALLLNALAVHGDAGPVWVRPYLWSKLAVSDRRLLQQALTLIEKTHQDFPRMLTPAEALVFILTRLEETPRALVAAQAAFETDPTDARRARLYFEAAMSERDPAATRAALGALEPLLLTPGEVGVLRARLALLEGRAEEARAALVDLLRSAPENAYYHYYLGCAELMSLATTDQPERAVAAAFDQLEEASLRAVAPPLRERVGQTLGFVRRLAAEEAEPREPRRRGFFDFSP